MHFEQGVTTINGDPVILITGIVLIILGIVFNIIAARIRSQWGKGDPRKAHVIGKVIGGGHISYGNNYIPRCAYEVDGKRYELDGPLFESGTYAPGLKCNCTSRENLPKTFRGPAIADRLVDTTGADSWYKASALYPLYPIGSDVDIYYDPQNPSHAYVQRPVRKGVIAHMMTLGWGISLVIMGIACIIIWKLEM